MNYESAKEFALVEQMLAAKKQLAGTQSDKSNIDRRARSDARHPRFVHGCELLAV